MYPFPSADELPPQQRARGFVPLRYEDVAQDGSLKVECLPGPMGQVAYGQLWERMPLSVNLTARGVLPILSRLAVQTTGGPISVENPVEVESWYRLGHTRDARGEVNRVLLLLGADLYAPRGRTYPPQPSGAGERIHVGSVCGEHVFTRPFAPPGERKVTALEDGGETFVPEPEMSFHSPLSSLALPEGARPLEAHFRTDEVPIVFGLAHTDSNQHVNSLAYLELFEDAALRRLFELGYATASLLVETIEVAYRKPCFAGERMQVTMQAFESGGEFGMLAFLGEPGQSPERSHCTCRLIFRGRAG